MFIDVTRYGGMRTLRVAAAAVAFVDAIDSGSALHLIGGETLRVNEDPAVIESRVVAALAPPPPLLVIEAPSAVEAGEADKAAPVTPPPLAPPAPPAQPEPRKRR